MMTAAGTIPGEIPGTWNKEEQPTRAAAPRKLKETKITPFYEDG